MAAVIRYCRDPFRPDQYEWRSTLAGMTAGDAVRATFPELADTPLTMERNGRTLYDIDVLEDGDTITIAARPEWVAAAGASIWTQAAAYVVNAFIYAAVSYLISYLMKPKGKKDKAASPAYSVAIDQNAARLGGTIPVQYGRCLAMPDIAAQPYAEFVAHNEQLSMILCLGMGVYTIHDIYLGESRVTDFPPGTVTVWTFDPAQHGQVFGNIERISGIVEDMLTIPESMGVDVAAPNDPPEVSVSGTASGGTLSPSDPNQGNLWIGLVPGKKYTVTNSAGGSVVTTYVGQGPNNSAVFDAALPTTAQQTWQGNYWLNSYEDAIEGTAMWLYPQAPFPARPPVDTIVYVDRLSDNKRFGPFQIFKYIDNPTRAYMRIAGPGFASQTGTEGFSPQQPARMVSGAYLVYYVTEYVEGVNPNEPYRWRGWYVTGRPGTVCDTIYIDLTAPNGIAWITDKGDYKSIQVQFYVDIQQIDDAGNVIGGLWRNTINMSGATSTARRQTFKFYVGGPGRFRVRIGRISQRDQRASKEISQITLVSIRARLWHAAQTPMYDNCTLIAMKFTASAGLNAAQNRRVTVDCTRQLYDVATDGWGANSNPGNMCFDAFSNADYGAMRPASEFDTAKFKRLMPQWGTTNGFNGIFDNETTLIEALQAVLAPVKAAPLPVGKVLSVVQDCPRDRSYSFGDDTIVKDTLSIAYLFNGENQPDCLCVTYRDPRSWAESRVYYPSEGIAPETVELFGCTSKDHALAWAKLTWQQRAYNRKRAQFELEGEGYLLDPLDRFGITVPAYGMGASGRVVQFDAATGDLTVDCEVPTGTALARWKGTDGTLSPPFTASRVDMHTVNISGYPGTPHGAQPDADATPVVLLVNADQFSEFSVTGLQTSQELRVQVTSQQYNRAAYNGTFVETWTPGD